MAGKRDFWDTLAWIAFAIVVLYFLLKAVGIINSPAIVDVITILSAGYFIGETVISVKYSIKSLKGDVEAIKDDLIELNRKCLVIKNKKRRLQ